MSPIRIHCPPVAAACLGLIVLGALGLSAPVRAGDDVYWSIGVAPAQGVAVGVSNLPPVIHAPPRVIYTPPRVVYTVPPVYFQSQPVYVEPAPWHAHRSHPGRGHGHGKWHGKGHGKWNDKGGPHAKPGAADGHAH